MEECQEECQAEVRAEEHRGGVQAEVLKKEFQAEVWEPGMLGGHSKPPRQLRMEGDQIHFL